MRFIDITHPHSAAMVPWPGDIRFEYRLGKRIRDGQVANVGQLSTSLHFGTHMDAPYHYNEAGLTIDRLPLDLFAGPARVFQAPAAGEIGRETFAGLDGRATPRVLIRTNACDDKSVFPAAIPTLAPGVPAWLGEQGVRLIGLDVPSVDQVDCPDMRVHHALDQAGIIILENLDLREAQPGAVYQLMAFPLRLAGADGSLVRAVLGLES